MKIFYVFSNSVFGGLCCFHEWSQWQNSPLSCGEAPKVCKHRTRVLIENVLSGIGAAFSGEDYDCYEKRNSCPSSQQDFESCDDIDCRK